MKNEVNIDGVVFYKKEDLSKDFVLIRSESAGVFFGKLEKTDLHHGIVELTDARRCWYWSGAASLSQLAVDGTIYPNKCKFPVTVPRIIVIKVIEVISMTEKAVKSLQGVPVWTA